MSEVLSSKEAAKRLDLTTQRIRQLCQEGKLTFDLTPLGRLIHASSVERLREIREQNERR